VMYPSSEVVMPAATLVIGVPPPSASSLGYLSAGA
jgi:hypothetical protein